MTCKKESKERKEREKSDDDDDDDDDEDDGDPKGMAELYARQLRVNGSQDRVPNWCGCIQVIDILEHESVGIQEMADKEGCFCFSLCTFSSYPNTQYLAVGCGAGMSPHNMTCTSASIHLYSFDEDTITLSLVSKTPVDVVPSALHSTHGCFF